VSLDNSKSLRLGGQLLIDAGSSLNLNGGNLRADSVANNGSFSFNSGSLALNSMTVGSGGLFNSLALTSSKRLAGGAITVGNGGTLNVGSGVQYVSTLINQATATVSGGYLSAGYVSNSGTVTVSGGDLGATAVSNSGTIAVTAGTVTSKYFTNTGTTSIDAGASLNIVPVNDNIVGAYTQTAGTTTVNGVLQGTVNFQGGVLNGSGQIDGDLNFSGGNLNPGNSPGAIEVTGDFTMTGGMLNLEVAKDGYGGYLADKIFVSGNYDLTGGSVRFSLLGDLDINTFINGFSFGDFFRMGNQASNTGLDIAMVAGLNFGARDAANHYYDFELTPTGAFVASASAVPVPSAVWLFGSGLLGLIGVSKRKKAA
jgi:fibronectin-binding autotransporter adhesin